MEPNIFIRFVCGFYPDSQDLWALSILERAGLYHVNVFPHDLCKDYTLVVLSKKEAHAYVDYLMNKWTNRT